MNHSLLWMMCAAAFSATASEMAHDATKGGLISTMLGRHSNQQVEVHLGETVSAAIAVGQINRIVLPFERPEIRTLNPSTAEIQGHVLYIAPIDTAKVHLYVTDTEDADAAIALTLSPQEITPRELQLTLVEDRGVRSRQNDSTGMTTREDTVSGASMSELTRNLLKTLAMGQIPEGYRFRSPTQGESIRCRQKHALIQTRQVFEAGKTQVRVGVLRNHSKDALVLDEESCAVSTQIQAVATYPSGPLAPGREVEIFVVVGPEVQDDDRSRPVLIAKKP